MDILIHKCLLIKLSCVFKLSLQYDKCFLLNLATVPLFTFSLSYMHLFHGHSLSPVMFILCAYQVLILHSISKFVLVYSHEEIKFLCTIVNFVFQWLNEKHKKALYEALEKVKDGKTKMFISLFEWSLNLVTFNFAHCCNLCCLVAHAWLDWYRLSTEVTDNNFTLLVLQSWWFLASFPYYWLLDRVTLLKSAYRIHCQIPCCHAQSKQILGQQRQVEDTVGNC